MTIASTNSEEQKAHHTFRISDIVNEPLEILPPITGYEDMPLVSLETAVEPLISFLPAIQSYVLFAKQRCKNPPADGLTIDESASIMLYSIGWKPLDQCLHIVLNSTLRSKDRNQLESWFPYLKLFLTALSHLPSTHQNIYRGVKLDLNEQYKIGETVVWWGFSSCTSLINVLQNEQFFNMKDERTLFTIDSYSGKDIHKHSYFQLEEEFLVLPGTQFSVQANFNQSNGVHSIRLQEIQSESNTNIATVRPKTDKIQDDQSSTITQMKENETIDIKSESAIPIIVDHRTISLQNDVIVAGGNESGDGLNQLHCPAAVYVDDDNETIYIADSWNHRIMEWKFAATDGQVIAGGNGEGDNINQLNWPSDVLLDKESNSLIICDQGNRRIVRWPRQNGTNGEIIISDIDCNGLTMDNNGYLYVSDKKKHEVRRWKIGDTSGTLVAGGNEEGDRLNQLNGPTFMFVDEVYSVYVSDCWNHRVMKWMKDAKEGIIVAGGQGRGDHVTQLSCPYGVVVDHLGTVYVADCGINRIMCWFKDAKQGIIGAGVKEFDEPPKQFRNPLGLSFDRQGNLYVVDQGNHQVHKLNIDQSSSSSILKTESV